MTAEDRDVANVIARPPLILLVALVAGLVLDQLYPAGHIAQMARWLRYLAAACALAAGAVLLGSAANEMRKAGTNIPTWEPTLAIVTSGVYGLTRNPIYLAFAILMVGTGLLFSSDWIFLLIPPFMMVLHFGVIRREEAYLLARFGAPYAEYMRRVPRYAFGI
jgi:protein-S-isoprenylcysteine O-methyltransferase Ste14